MSAVALTAIMGSFSSVSASDKGVDIKTSGQGVLYYNTRSTQKGGFGDLGSRDVSKAHTAANYGIQLNFDSDLKNGFTFGSQLNYLGTLGLEKNAVNGTMQNTNGGIAENNIADDIYLSQLNIAKTVGKTTVKLGRQELPKSLSPFAFSRGGSVFRNTFDAILVVNSDIPDTLLVGAYVGKNNGFGNDTGRFTNLKVGSQLGNLDVNGTAYMLTAQNKSIPLTTATLSYYRVTSVAGSVDADIFWGDAKIAGRSLPLGLKIGIQGGQISPDSGLDSTTAFGVKASVTPVRGFSFTGAYTSVNDGAVSVQNTTAIKTPLYTQMTANQKAIALDADTVMLKATYGIRGIGKIIARGTQTSAGSANLNASNKDNSEFDLLFKTKVSGINLLAAYYNIKTDGKKAEHMARLVARYKF